MRQKCMVKLSYGSYSDEETIDCDENEFIIAKTFHQAGCNFLPMAYKQGEIIRRENVDIDY